MNMSFWEASLAQVHAPGSSVVNLVSSKMTKGPSFPFQCMLQEISLFPYFESHETIRLARAYVTWGSSHVSALGNS